jgi:hypothetical protein
VEQHALGAPPGRVAAEVGCSRWGTGGAVPASANGGSAPTVQADWLISLLPPVGRCRRTDQLSTRLDDGEGRDPEPVLGPDGIFELVATELLERARKMRLVPRSKS